MVDQVHTKPNRNEIDRKEMEQMFPISFVRLDVLEILRARGPFAGAKTTSPEYTICPIALGGVAPKPERATEPV